ncbi:hypothetical protein C8A05DRAFT_36304 [Staphylotrichum tortipilum]|uniref:Uncharacterized protein n=1 Tax=Staphylotrichum tortipilum TaxID=2831512 RepID=A0AAN6MGD2_9PEZI|nr:hypothetical protein C8A05DRAFT_36304 [Staphylotrichum longicolle]
MADDTTAMYAELERLPNDLPALYATRAPAWVSAPNMRGTSSILYSCLLTLFACIYTALHLNVPKSGSSFASLLFTKVVWSLVALFAPELVIVYALSQYFKARKLAKAMRKLQRDDPKAATRADADPDPDKCTFDLKYGFFVAMGGFELATADGLDERIRTLSPKGLLKLAAVNIAPFMIPSSRIEDQSKADTLQKALVLLQVGWVMLQCIARKAYGLPITLLELHTMMHVVCAVAMYAFWLQKSHNLRSAEVLDYNHFKTSTRKDDNEIENVPMDMQKDFCPRGSNLPDVGAKKIFSGLAELIADEDKYVENFGVLFLLLSLAYGGVHLSAWNFEFPTATESLLWKISGDLPVLTGIFRAIDKAIVLVFVVCRLYIVVEAFVSLRSVPIGVYWTPSWIQMIPHV